MNVEIKYPKCSVEELSQLEDAMRLFSINYDIEPKNISILVDPIITGLINICPLDFPIQRISWNKNLIKNLESPKGKFMDLQVDRDYLRIHIYDLSYDVHLKPKNSSQ